MDIRAIEQKDIIWNNVSVYARDCTWVAGKFLAKQMDKNDFTEWERVIVAIIDDEIAGYCTVAKKDCIPDVDYTPYIGYIFVGEKFRGQRLSQKMIEFSKSYVERHGFKKIYIVSGEIGLYEKYGFQKIDTKQDLWGNEEQIFCIDF